MNVNFFVAFPIHFHIIFTFSFLNQLLLPFSLTLPLSPSLTHSFVHSHFSPFSPHKTALPYTQFHSESFASFSVKKFPVFCFFSLIHILNPTWIPNGRNYFFPSRKLTWIISTCNQGEDYDQCSFYELVHSWSPVWRVSCSSNWSLESWYFSLIWYFSPETEKIERIINFSYFHAFWSWFNSSHGLHEKRNKYYTIFHHWLLVINCFCVS